MTYEVVVFDFFSILKESHYYKMRCVYENDPKKRNSKICIVIFQLPCEQLHIWT